MHQRRIALFVIIAASIAAAAAPAQTACDIGWATPVRLSPDSSLPTLPSIAVSGGTVHLTWFGLDTTSGGTLSRSGLCYARSTDDGETFSEPLRLLSPFESFPGQLAASGGRVFITAGALLDTFFGLVVFSSTDGGASWSGPGPLLPAAFPEMLYADGARVLVGYREIESSAYGLIGSSDGGATWRKLAQRIRGFTTVTSWGAGIYGVGPAPGASQIEAGFYQSTDAGLSWFGPTIVSPEDLVRSSYPDLSVNPGGSFFVVWTDTGRVILRSSRNAGVSWGGWSRLSDEPGSLAARVASDAEFVAVTWDLDVGGVKGVRLRVSNDSGATFCPALSPGEGATAREPELAVVDSALHLVWVEERGGTEGIFYRRGALPRNDSGGNGVPVDYALGQSYPNPTNGRAVIGFDLPEETEVTLRLFNVVGETVLTPARGVFGPGRHRVPVEVGGLASGVYYYRLTTPGFTGVGRMVVVR